MVVRRRTDARLRLNESHFAQGNLIQLSTVARFCAIPSSDTGSGMAQSPLINAAMGCYLCKGVGLVQSKHMTKRKRIPLVSFSFCTPRVGLEPTTLRLTAACSTDWANEEYWNVGVQNCTPTSFWVPATPYLPGRLPAKYCRHHRA